MQYYIGVAQNQYFNHVQDKISTLKMESGIESLEVVNQFKIKLMEHALTPEKELHKLYESNN